MGSKKIWENIFKVLFISSRIKQGQPNRMTSSKDQGPFGSMAGASGTGDADDVDGGDLRPCRKTATQELGSNL